MYFDIHSHILPGIDDGAKDMKESVQLLKMMKKSGISTVLATSHFYPIQVNLEGYLEATNKAYQELKEEVENKKLPQIYLGCEMLYYKGIGNSDVLKELCLNKSKFLLLELTDFDINDNLFEDILNLKKNADIVPIIAHIERYCYAHNFKKFLKFVKENNIPVQINTDSVMLRNCNRVLKTIFKNDIFCVLATDTHSVDRRPPLMKEAYVYVRDNFGAQYRERLVKNAKKLYQEIIGEDIEK